MKLHSSVLAVVMLYKHKKSTDSREQRVIVDYRHLWDGVLRRCCKDPKITTEQTAEIIAKNDGTMPEDLPTPEKSIAEIGKEQLKKLKAKKEPPMLDE